jgi:hypothetical protein
MYRQELNFRAWLKKKYISRGWIQDSNFLSLNARGRQINGKYHIINVPTLLHGPVTVMGVIASQKILKRTIRLISSLHILAEG